MERQFTAQKLNEIVNSPGVYEWVAQPGQGELDLGELVRNPAHVLLVEGDAALLFVQLEPCVYEVHTQALSSARGAPLVALVHKALHWMFTRTDAMEVWTQVPEGNKGALGLVRAIQGEREFTRSKVWPTRSGPVDSTYYSMRVGRWIRTSPLLELRGWEFHEALVAKKRALGHTEPLHEDDSYHDRMVGATWDMFVGGQVDKAATLYNRWARIAGYATISLLSRAPVIVDIQDSILALSDDGFHVVRLERAA